MLKEDKYDDSQLYFSRQLNEECRAVNTVHENRRELRKIDSN